MKVVRQARNGQGRLLALEDRLSPRAVRTRSKKHMNRAVATHEIAVKKSRAVGPSLNQPSAHCTRCGWSLEEIVARSIFCKGRYR